MLIARAAINEGFDATHIPSYGPESRGGTSYADVRDRRGRGALAGGPRARTCSSRSTRRASRVRPAVVPGGVVVYDRSVVAEPPILDARVRLLGVPCARRSPRTSGCVTVKNIVALGALRAATRLFPEETYLAAIRQALAHKPELLVLDERAFAAGVRAAVATG